MSKKSILDPSTLNFISNMARGAKSDTDKEMSEDDSISKTELLASNFSADLRLNSESDASNLPTEPGEAIQEESSTKNEQFVRLDKIDN